MNWLATVRIVGAATLTVGIALVAACDQTVGPLSNLDSDSEARALLSPPNVGAMRGAWARCTPVDPDGGSWPFTCPDPASDGCGELNSHDFELADGNEVCVLATFCDYSCHTDADCPAPPSGSIEPICRSQCYLPCAETSECPDGMICFSDGFVENGVRAHCAWTYPCTEAF